MTLPYPVSANRYWRHARGMTFLSKEAKAYREQVAWIAKSAGAKPEKCAVNVSLQLCPRTNKDGSASKRRLDLGNCWKVAEDALNGVAWADDAQVHKLTMEIGYACEGGALIVNVVYLR